MTRTELWHATEATRLYFELMVQVEASTSLGVEDDDFDPSIFVMVPCVGNDPSSGHHLLHCTE